MRLSIGNINNVVIDPVTKKVEAIDQDGKITPIKKYKTIKKAVNQKVFIGVFPEIELSKRQFLNLLSYLNNENNSYAYNYESLGDKYIIT